MNDVFSRKNILKVQWPESDQGNSPGFDAQYYQFSEAPVRLPFSRRDFYKIWLMRCEGLLHFTDRSVHISRPALVFSNPLVPYSYEGLVKERSGYWCIFTEAFLRSNDRIESLQESPLFKIGSNNIFLLDAEQLSAIEHIFNKMIAELATEYPYKYDLIRNYVHLLMHEGIKMQPAPAAHQSRNASGRIANLFLELLESQFPIESPQRPLKLRKASDYAGYLAIHVNHLNFAVKESTGKPTRVHIAERVLHEAKALLRHTDWNIAEIAYSLGFEYAHHFTTFFKKHTGSTPLSVRR